LVTFSGCGGSSGSPATGSGGVEQAFGELSMRSTASVGPRPELTSSPAVTATGITGNFSSLRLRRVRPSHDEVRLLTSFGNGVQFQLKSAASDGTDIRDLGTPAATTDWMVTATADGRRIAFVRNNPPGIYTATSTGSAPTRITSDISDASPSFNPDGSRILFTRQISGRFQVHEVVVATGVVTQRTFEPFGAYEPTYVNDTNKFAYVTSNGSVSSVIYVEPLVGGAWTSMQASGGITIQDIDASPTREELAVTGSGSGTGYVWLASPVGATPARTITSFGGAGYSIAYSPDGERFALYGTDPGFVGALWTVQRQTGAMTLMFDMPVATFYADWLAAPTERILIGASGAMMGTAASGIVFAQNAERTQSVVTFRAVTPSTAVVQALTRQGATEPLLMFNVEADAINSLTFVNHPSYVVRTAIGSSVSVTSAAGALVSINARTGEVASVLPYVGTRSQSRAESNASGATFRGEFMAAYNGKGENLAPNGAREVRVDAKTGKLSVTN
jgi:dipeptidyl aminopeptidase/acylaminoacyl peptidase